MINALVGLGVVVLVLGVVICVVFARPRRRPRDRIPFRCPHTDLINGGQHTLCARFGCPDDPDWIGDRR